MALSFKPKSQVIRPYRRQVISGVGGVGKSTLVGVSSVKPMIIDLDNRWPADLVGKADFPSFAPTFVGLKKLLEEILATDKIDNDNIVIDTATKAVELIEQHALEVDCKGSKDAFNAYGYGLKFVHQYFKELLDTIDAIQEKHKVTATFIAHSKLKDQRNPGGEVYQKNCLDLNDKVADRLKQWADFVGFAWFDVAVDTKNKRAIGDQIRYISFTENPRYEAKNSSPFAIPEKIELDKEGEWADVVFGKTQPLLKELDDLLASVPEGPRKVIQDRIAEAGVRTYGVERLKDFIEAGKAQFKKG